MQAPRVIDAHVHFWDPERLHYPWLTEVPALRRAFLPEQFGGLAARAVDAVIFVEANCELSEAALELEFVDGLAADEPRISGTVAFVDMTDVETRNTRLESLARRDRVVGVRHNVQGRAGGDCLSSAFISGVQEAGALDLTFDLCVTADQLDDAIALVSRCPETRFVLDHSAKPAIHADAFVPWAAGVANLAAFENVVCKVSGLLTEARPDQRNATALRPYIEHVRHCFGPTRLLYGSDWPVVNLAGGEELWRTTLHEITHEWPAAERQLFYYDNAMRHYSLQRHVIR
jgi:L-fuconolactonase